MVAKAKKPEADSVDTGDIACTLPMPRFRDGMYKWQRDALRAFDEGRARFGMFMCHRRSRKTTLSVNLQIREACTTPNTVHRYIAPTRIEGFNIIWKDPMMLDSALPDKKIMDWEKNKGEMSVTFENGSIYQVEGANKITKTHRGKDCHSAVFDEWAMHENPEIWTAIIRPMLALDPTRWAWFFFTPNGANHAIEMYRNYQRQIAAGEIEDTLLVMLTAKTSGIISPKELARAKRDMPDALFRQEFFCEVLISSERILIQPVIVDRLQTIHHAYPEERRVISCDVGFEGDECVLMAIVNTEVIEMVIMHPLTTQEIVGALMVMGAKFDITDFVIDNIGNGKGVYDLMGTNPEYTVQEFDARLKSEFEIGESKVKCFNRRAEAWVMCWQEMQAGRVAYPYDMKTRNQISSVRFELKRNGAIGMELKEKVKKRIHESPDRADCFVAGQWALHNVKPYTGRREVINPGYQDETSDSMNWQAA